MGTMEQFTYNVPAEIYSSGGAGTRKRPASYRRFSSSAEAIRFAVEQLPSIMQRGTAMEIGDDRYDFADIRALYESDRYPLPRDCDSAETDEPRPASDAKGTT